MSDDSLPPAEQTSSQIASLIQGRCAHVLQIVITKLIELHWEMGKVLIEKTARENWAKKAHENPALLSQYETKLPEKKLLQANRTIFSQLRSLGSMSLEPLSQECHSGLTPAPLSNYVE